ncbi:beta-galactoside-binding lectin-like [Conger conger]|uniref:beta-galactoside-binding lectin-like n=1 Tax=Conger conger TaxID=82655 RepID=UPI002A59A44A|nr:beta-galactoside-binding lectin-like [Conger conger]
MTQPVVVKNMSFKAGQTLTITGVANAKATGFAINVGHEKDIALHMNARFDAHGDQRTVVCNSYQGGKWCEEVRDASFPFQQGKEFKLLVTFNAKEFQVTLSDGKVIRFPNRLGDSKYQHLKFEGEARIQGLEVK